MTKTLRPAPARVDAVVLAGGSGRRLGGAAKPLLDVGGRTLLSRVLEAVAGAEHTVVVAPESIAVPRGVIRTLEDPPGGGPVAGLAAGIAALPRGEVCHPGVTTDPNEPGRRETLSAEQATAGAGPRDPEGILVLACDLPGAAGAVPALLAAFTACAPDRDGVIALDADGRRQHLAVVLREAPLAAALRAEEVRGASMRALLAGLVLDEVPIAGDALEDIDTWEQHAAWEARLRGTGDEE